MKIEGVEAKCLLDTGFQITCMSKEFYDINFERLKKCPKLPIVVQSVRGATGRHAAPIKFQILANTELDMNIQEDVPYVVVAGLNEQIILGIDSLQALQFIIDCGNQEIKYKGYKLNNLKQTHKSYKCEKHGYELMEDDSIQNWIILEILKMNLKNLEKTEDEELNFELTETEVDEKLKLKPVKKLNIKV